MMLSFLAVMLTVFERFSNDDPINQNSRIYNLAEKLDLNHRIISKVNEENAMSCHINYKRVYCKLGLLIEESLKYL